MSLGVVTGFTVRTWVVRRWPYPSMMIQPAAAIHAGEIGGAAEIPLVGGDVTDGVVRVGDTVRRPVRPHSAAVHALLRHLERSGFDAAPRFLGIDALGREILTYVPGVTPPRPLPAYAAGDDALVGVARLLRRYHDAASGFTAPEGTAFDTSASSNFDAAPEVVGHCDLTPDNVVFRDGRPVAMIDFDMARPTTRLFDVVTALRHWAPIADPIDRDPAHEDAPVGPRIARFCAAYGLDATQRPRVLPGLRVRLDRSYTAMRDRARTRGGPWARMWSAGAGPRLTRAIDWLDLNWDALEDHLH